MLINFLLTNLYMKQCIIVGVVLALFPFGIFAQTISSQKGLTTTILNPGLVPTDFFYFLDRFGEGINSFFTFRTESKVNLSIEHAQERAAEIHAVVKIKGIESSEVKEAKKNFDENLANIVVVFTEEKAKGNDVSTLSRDIDNKFEDSLDMLEEVFRTYAEDLKNEKKRIEVDIRTAKRSGNALTTTALQAELMRLSNEQLMLEKEEKISHDLEEEELEEIEDKLEKEEAKEKKNNKETESDNSL